ncbi:MAG TPA: hypothetical protein VFQ45_09230 [Longimicrobium sp.]|nr:hypothetical protein [Longimicrobium sp.]
MLKPGLAARAAVLGLLTLALAACSDDGRSLLPDARRAPDGPVLAGLGTCKSSGIVRGLYGDVNADLNDFGRVLYDADQGPLACLDTAAAAMKAKINGLLDAEPSRFGNYCTNPKGCGFNAGGVLALVFAAAERIHTKGGMTLALDSALRRAEAAYKFDDRDDGCALQSTDNCMDGHSVAASGFGWIAAYRAVRGDNADAARASTVYHIHKTFESACLFTGFTGVAKDSILCKGTPLDVHQGRATTLSLNIGQQYPAYGFGLMTSIAAAVLGYDVSGSAYQFLDSEIYVARGLFAEAQGTIDTGPSPDAFKGNCPWIGQHPTDRYWRVDSLNAPCGGKGGGYQPQMYALNAFYSAYIGGIPSGGYMSTAWDSSTAAFPKETSPYGFFAYGRWETYGKLGYDWFVNPRTPRSYVDLYAPQGAAEGIDEQLNLVGWACDRDVAGATVRVVARAPGKPEIMLRTGVTSESAINTQCGGGTAHRFRIRLPQDWTGLTVSVSVLDYFGRRSTSLACSACVVPSVTVEWLQPSGVTWGPPNTLTAAGLARNGRGTVRMEWRDVTFNPYAAWVPVDYRAPVDAYGQWSNTVPASNYCHIYEVRATYNGVVSEWLRWNGKPTTHCKETARVIWIQPQTMTGWGTPGALIVAGEAKGAPAGTTVTMYWRNVTTGGSFVKAPYNAPTDANGIWINDIPNANYLHKYQVYVTYDAVSSLACTYQGANDITWC